MIPELEQVAHDESQAAQTREVMSGFYPETEQLGLHSGTVRAPSATLFPLVEQFVL